MSYLDLKKLKKKGSSVLSYLNDVAVVDENMLLGYGQMYMMPHMHMNLDISAGNREEASVKCIGF